MPHVRSAAFKFMLPAGCVNDPENHLGLSTVLAEMISRGAGKRDSRELSDALDNLGVDRSESASLINMHFSGITLARNLLPALEIYSDILRKPRLPKEDLEASQSLAIQDIQALEDEPQARVMVELRKRHFPEPLDRDVRGTVEGVQNLTIDALRKQHARLFHPKECVLAVAGDIQWAELKDKVGQLFGDWEAKDLPKMTVGTTPGKSEHITKDIEQTQITLAYASVPRPHPDYYNASGAVAVLSMDMSSRLFSNIREKYGLCYSVYASYESLPDRANVVCYAGCRPEDAQQTLDLLIQELQRLKDGIEEDELDRVKVGMKSSMIMRQESTYARVLSLSNDWYYLSRIVPLDEVQQSINGLTVKGILDYVNRHPAKDFTIVTLGPMALRFPARG
jgi:predicted Zn-dependent peptidase